MKILKKIKNWLKGYEKRYPSFLDMQYEIEKSSYKWKQELSDKNIERQARMEAYEMFINYKENKLKKEEWDRAHNYDYKTGKNIYNPYAFNSFITKSQCSLILVYPNQVSKFDKQGSYQELVNKLFKEMKEYEDNKTRS